MTRREVIFDRLGKRDGQADGDGEFTTQNRGGKASNAIRSQEKTGNVVGVKAVDQDKEIMLITTKGVINRMMCNAISVLGRVTSGVKLIHLDEEVLVASIAKVRDESNKTEEDTLKSLENQLNEEL